jgi:hypothetical protein
MVLTNHVIEITLIEITLIEITLLNRDLAVGIVSNACYGNFSDNFRGHRDRMVAGFTTTYAISAYHH